MRRQLAQLPRGELARAALQKFGALVHARDPGQAIEWTNMLGPEHLHIATRNAEKLLEKIENAGAIFLGHYSPVAVGDYVAGPSHVLPTGGAAPLPTARSATALMRGSLRRSFRAPR